MFPHFQFVSFLHQVFKPHLEILPTPQPKLWPALRPVTDQGFILYGGTAIALRLGHRISVDFDFFSVKQLNRGELFQSIGFLAEALVLQDEPNSLTVLVPVNGEEKATTVKVSFFGGIDFGCTVLPDQTEDGILVVASLEDLLGTKLKVILQQAEANYYRDIASILKSGLSLDRGLATARVFFGPSFQPSEALKALTYFDDGDLESLSESEQKTLREATALVRDLPAVKRIS